MVKRAETCLNICTWNVGGMISDKVNKASDRLFVDTIKEYDIVLLVETHIGYNTYIDIEGFQYYAQGPHGFFNASIDTFFYLYTSKGTNTAVIKI